MKRLILFLFVLGSALYAQIPGSIDPSFSGITSGFNGYVYAVAVQPDGKILVGGGFTTYNGVDCPNKLVRLTSTGALDDTFTGLTSGFDEYDEVYSLAVQPDGKILVGGWFSTYNGINCPDRFIRLTSTGVLDDTFTGLTSGFNSYIYSIVVQPDGKILVGGDISTYNGVNCPDMLVRLTSTGALDDTFSGITSGFNNVVYSIVVQPDGKILVGGEFTTYNGVNCPDRLVQLTSTGALDGTFSGITSGFNVNVRSIAIQGDGKILVAGGFTTYNGVNCPDRLVRLTSTGALDGTFSGITSGFNSDVFSVAVQSDGKILVGGVFTTYNGVNCPDNLVRLTSTGALDDTFTGLTSGFNSWLYSIVVQPNGKILAGGNITTYNGVDCPDKLVRLNNLTLPLITTSNISSISNTGAFVGCNITNGGNSTITKRGICWSANGLPTILGEHADETGNFGAGIFTANLSGLQPGTTYRVRAYAENSAGLNYGDEITFTTIPTLGQWGLIAFGSLLAIIGGAVVWKRFV